MEKTTLEILRDSRAWLTDPSHWMTYNRWGGVDGQQNCALGALERSMGATGFDMSYCIRVSSHGSTERLASAAQIMMAGTPWLAQTIKDYGSSSGYIQCAVLVAQLNNQLGHAKVLEMFDLAIQLEQLHMDVEAKRLVDSVNFQAETALSK